GSSADKNRRDLQHSRSALNRFLWKRGNSYRNGGCLRHLRMDQQRPHLRLCSVNVLPSPARRWSRRSVDTVLLWRFFTGTLQQRRRLLFSSAAAASIYYVDSSADTLQLGVGNECLVIQLSHCDHVPDELRIFLLDPDTIFIGIGELLDLRNYAQDCRGRSMRRCSFEEIVDVCMRCPGVRLDPEISMSDWSAEDLSHEQIRQASLDTFPIADTVLTPMVPSPLNPQQIQQFLSSVLSQRGPNSVPYDESTKWLIRQHLLNLISSYPSLEPKTATFIHNDGRSVNLLQADGTIPMPYHGVTYNIPVIIWLLESYPRHPPCVYVNPTADMIIKRPHAHVTPSGLVSLPYLQNWVYPSSNLVDLVSDLGAAFANDPPLYSRRRPGPSPTPPPYETRPPPPPQTADQRPFPPSPYGRVQHVHHQDDAAEVYKRNAINKMVEMVHGDLASMRRDREAEAESMLSLQGGLKRREEEINRGMKEMVEEKETLEQQLQIISMNTDVLDSWVRENQGKTNIDVDVDKAFECVDALSKQMLECTASDLAIEDAVYALDKGFQDGVVPFDQYLRSVRLLSREQFFHRATGSKVRAAQMEAQVHAIAGRLHS
ncbi:unnamed protein product, partial [Brassica oleracea]